MHKIKQSCRLQTRRNILFADFFGRFVNCLDLNVMARSNQNEESNELHGTLMQRFHASFAASGRSLACSSTWKACYVKWFPPAVCGLNGSP
jgi:hypothetical protein